MPSNDFETRLAQYADVIVQVGLNVQPGQKVVISAPLDMAPLVRLVTARAYAAGSPLVEVDWLDDQLDLIRLQNAPADTLDTVSQWRYDGLAEQAENQDSFLFLYGPDPDLFAGQDADAVMTMNRARLQGRRRFNDLRRMRVASWAGCAVPTPGWTQKVFADLDPDERKAHAWEAIFDVCRVTGDDPVAGWREHSTRLKQLAARMTERAYHTLHLSGPGTDLTIGLPDNHVWIGGGDVTESGNEYTANIPTEEIFTVTDRTRVNGTLSTTKPLNYSGSIIDDVTFMFKDGRVTQAEAMQGQDILDKLLNIDEGASFSGEIALVPHSSPISQAGRIFYSTLIDENASCHLAFGSGYPFNLKGGTKMSPEELAAAGVNQSISHTDFMIGSDKLDVDGHTADGQVEPLMRGGEWVIEV